MTEETPDYTVMSGAELSRAVGVDPAKWAVAFVQYCRARMTGDPDIMAAAAEQWFADAMEAARAEARRFHRIGEGE